MKHMKVAINYGDNDVSNRRTYVDKSVIVRNNEDDDPIDVDKYIECISKIQKNNSTKEVLAGSIALELSRQLCRAFKTAGYDISKISIMSFREDLNALVSRLIDEADSHIREKIRDLIIYNTEASCEINHLPNTDLTDFKYVINKITDII